MSKFYVREKANPSNVIACDWQNAFELVNHGFWEWPTGNGKKEFLAAQKLARNAPAPEGFDRSVDLDDAPDDDDDVIPAFVPVTPPAPPAPTVEQIAATKVDTSEKLEDMTREELFAVTEKMGLTIDRRTGTKNLLNAIKAAQEAE